MSSGCWTMSEVRTPNTVPAYGRSLQLGGHTLALSGTLSRCLRPNQPPSTTEMASGRPDFGRSSIREFWNVVEQWKVWENSLPSVLSVLKHALSASRLKIHQREHHHKQLAFLLKAGGARNSEKSKTKDWKRDEKRSKKQMHINFFLLKKYHSRS